MSDNPIAVSILSGELTEAAEDIHQRLAELSLDLLEAYKVDIAKNLFTEDFDASPKGKSQFDQSKDDDDDSDDDNDDDSDDKDDDSDNDDHDDDSDDHDDDHKDDDDDDKDDGKSKEIDIKIKK